MPELIEPVQLSHGLHLRSVRKESREATFVASTAAVDSYGEIVEQTWRLERYLSNPVVLFAHQSRELPIGQSTSVAVINGQLECVIKFATADANPKAEQVWQSVQEGVLRAVSVGFMPNEYRWEMRDGKEVLVLSDNELHEVSVVPIPANPEALAKMKSKAREAQNANAKQAARAAGETTMTIEEMKAEIAKRDAAHAAELASAKTIADDAHTHQRNTEKALADERTAHAETKTALEAATKAAAEVSDKLIALEVDALVGVKITPAEKDGFVELAKASRTIFDKQVAARPALKMLTPVIETKEKADGNKLHTEDAFDELTSLALEPTASTKSGEDDEL